MTQVNIHDRKEANEISKQNLPKDPLSGNSFYALLFLGLQSMSLLQEGLNLSAQQIKSSAASITSLQNEENAIVYPAYPSGNPTHTQIVKIQQEIQKAGAQKEDLQRLEITARQSAQVLMTQGNTMIGALEQNGTTTANFIKMIHTALQAIQQMTPLNTNIPRGGQ